MAIRADLMIQNTGNKSTMELAVEEIMALRQVPVKNYCEEFKNLFDRVKNSEEICEYYAIYLFMNGLELEIRDVFITWHQYSFHKLKDYISLALKLDASKLRDSFSPYDPNSVLYDAHKVFDVMSRNDNGETSKEVGNNSREIDQYEMGSCQDMVNVIQESLGSDNSKKKEMIIERNQQLDSVSNGIVENCAKDLTSSIPCKEGKLTIELGRNLAVVDFSYEVDDGSVKHERTFPTKLLEHSSCSTQKLVKRQAEIQTSYFQLPFHVAALLSFVEEFKLVALEVDAGRYSWHKWKSKSRWTELLQSSHLAPNEDACKNFIFQLDGYDIWMVPWLNVVVGISKFAGPNSKLMLVFLNQHYNYV